MAELLEREQEREEGYDSFRPTLSRQRSWVRPERELPTAEELPEDPDRPLKYKLEHVGMGTVPTPLRRQSRPWEQPSSRVEHPAEEKFIRLRDQWKAEKRHESSTIKLVMHPAYQTIIGMGQDAVPFLLRELETNLDNWFWALRAITEANPVPDEIRGDGQAMAEAWLKWGREQRYQW
jgi:hypothetical protein